MPDSKKKQQPLKAASAAVDPFLMKKWERVFSMFFDRNMSKNVDWKDFYLVMRKARDIYGAESAQMTFAKKSLESLWDGLREVADMDKDSVITLDEWVALLRNANSNRAAKWLSDYSTYMFKLFDVSADGVMDLAEYTDGMEAYGYASAASHQAFETFALDKKGNPVKALNPTEWKDRFYEYFFSKDRKSLGNHLFGKMEL